MVRVVYATTFSIEHLRLFPSNFSYYLTEIEKDSRFDVHLLNPKDYSGNIIVKTIKMCRHLRQLKTDILYLTLWQGYNNLVLAKILGLIKCKIVIWKYTYCIEGSNILSKFFYKKVYWPCIDRIYMMFDNHTEDALKKKIVSKKQIVTLSRGTDVNWYEKYQKVGEDKPFLVIATGKDHRDYFTLGQACEETRTQCKIITFKHQTCLDAAEKYKDSEYVHFVFMENGYGVEPYCYLVNEVSQASVMAICCEKLPYGAGYTNIVESLAFRIPILQTLNPDVHLDPEKEGIGFSIAPYDVEGWKKKISLLKDNNMREQIGSNIQRLLDGEYNSKATTEFIKKDFIKIVGK